MVNNINYIKMNWKERVINGMAGIIISIFVIFIVNVVLELMINISGVTIDEGIGKVFTFSTSLIILTIFLSRISIEKMIEDTKEIMNELVEGENSLEFSELNHFDLNELIDEIKFDLFSAEEEMKKRNSVKG